MEYITSSLGFNAKRATEEGDLAEVKEKPASEGQEKDASENQYVDVEQGTGEASILENSRTGQKGREISSLRSGTRLNRADRSHVEKEQDEDPLMSNTEAVKIRAKHIVKIFVDDREFMEISPEQLARVRAMHKRIDDGASFSFNYNTLLFVASILAGLGLVSNSNTTIIASMLVSPIMGPVIGLGMYEVLFCSREEFESFLLDRLGDQCLTFCVLFTLLCSVWHDNSGLETRTEIVGRRDY